MLNELTVWLTRVCRHVWLYEVWFWLAVLYWFWRLWYGLQNNIKVYFNGTTTRSDLWTTARLRGHPHGNAFLCKHTCFASFLPIVKMDPANALYWNLVSGWKHFKTLPLCSCLDSKSTHFEYQWRHRHRPTPQLLAFNPLTPRQLIKTTTMADYMLVFVLQKILSPLGSLGQRVINLIIGPHKRFWFPHTSHFHLLLLVLGFFFYCLLVYSLQAL